MKTRLVIVISLCFVLLLLPLSHVGSADVSLNEAPSEITVPWKSSAEADGFIKVGEYDDALEINLTRDDWEAYLYLKHDGEYLYVFIDHVSDTVHHPAGYDNGWVVVDTLSDGGDAPKEDDYMFHSSGHHIYVGDGPCAIEGFHWAELYGHGLICPELESKSQPFLNGEYAGSGPGAFGLSSRSSTKHAIFEIKFPITGWEIEGANRTFRFCAAAGSPGTQGDLLGTAVWPETAYDNFTGDFYAGGVRTLDPLIVDPEVGSFPPPSTWDTITLSDVPPPSQDEGNYWLYVGIAVVAVVIVLAAVVLLRRRK